MIETNHEKRYMAFVEFTYKDCLIINGFAWTMFRLDLKNWNTVEINDLLQVLIKIRGNNAK